MNYGQGSIHQEKTKTVAECCKLCADNSDCKAWDWNPASSTCYEKDNTDPTPGSTCPGTKCRYSGKMPSKAAGDNSTGAAVATIAAPAPPGKSHRMTGNPPESTTAFDDSSWDQVDTPCGRATLDQPRTALLNSACCRCLLSLPHLSQSRRRRKEC